MHNVGQAKPNSNAKVKISEVWIFFWTIPNSHSQIIGSHEFSSCFKRMIFEQHRLFEAKSRRFTAVNQQCRQTGVTCADPSLTGAPEGGRRSTRLANCAAEKAVMRGGREAGCSSQLLESCAPPPSPAAAVTRFTSTSAASGENLRGRTPHLRALSSLASAARCCGGNTQALGSRPDRQQVRPGVLLELCFQIFQSGVLNPHEFSPSFLVLPVAVPLKGAAILD